MATSTITVSLPDALREYIDAQVATGDFASEEEFLCHLVEEDLSHQRTNLETRLKHSMESGSIPVPLNEIPEGGLVDFLRARLNENLEHTLIESLKEQPIRITEDEWAHGDIMRIASERLAQLA